MNLLQKVKELKDKTTPGERGVTFGTEYKQESKETWIVNRGLRMLCAVDTEPDAEAIALLPELLTLVLEQAEEIEKWRDGRLMQASYTSKPLN